MEGSILDAKYLLENKSVVVFYFAILLLLIVLVVWYLKKMSGTTSEHYYGYGLGDTVNPWTSGADVRFQEFTQTNQGSTPVNMATIKQTYPNLIPNDRKKERLTSAREAPVFYDISQTLGEYQYASQFNCADGSVPMPTKDAYGNVTYACPDGSTPLSFMPKPPQGEMTTEYATSSPATAVQEALLFNQLH